MTAYAILSVTSNLRARRRLLRQKYGDRGLQTLAVDAVVEVATRFRDPDYSVRILSEANPGVFPFQMIWVSLERLLDCLTQRSLNKLIESENCVGRLGPDLIGHVIASNTPLIGWTSAIRALLVGSASLIKAPSSPNAVWVQYFLAALRDVSPELAGLAEVYSWQGGDDSIESVLFPALDVVIAYGDDHTIGSIERRCEDLPVVGYGHMTSVGFILDDADYEAAAQGSALDIMMYDQGGCLSPQTIFVEGGLQDARRFGELLASAMAACQLRLSVRSATAAGEIRQARSMAQFEPDTAVYGDCELNGTVIVKAQSAFAMSCGHSVIYVVPWQRGGLTSSLAAVSGKLQAASIAGRSMDAVENLANKLRDLGASYICKPGNMQKPPFSWRENNKDVLASLLLR